MSDEALVAVTGSTVPYIYDLPHILSLPEGFEFRFRYFPRWVDLHVRSTTGSLPPTKAFVGADLLLVFHSVETQRLLPVRRGKVISVERLGPLYYLRFAVGEFVRIRSDVIDSDHPDAAIEAARSELEGFGKELLGAESWDLSKGLPDGKYLFAAPNGGDVWQRIQLANAATSNRGNPGLPEGSAEAPADHQWATVASLLLDEPNLSGIPMFYLHGMVNRAGNARKPKPMKNSFSAAGRTGSGYPLVYGDGYRLRLIQWRGRSHSGDQERQYRAVCEVDEATLHVEGMSDLVLGKYDVLEYSLRAISPGYSELLLRVDALPPTGSAAATTPALGTAPAAATPPTHAVAWPQVYSVRIPIQVRPRWTRIIGTAVVFLIGLLLLLAPSILPLWLPDREAIFTAPVKTVLQLLGTLLVFTAYGGFLSGYVKFAGDTQKLVAPPSTGGTK